MCVDHLETLAKAAADDLSLINLRLFDVDCLDGHVIAQRAVIGLQPLTRVRLIMNLILVIDIFGQNITLCGLAMATIAVWSTTTQLHLKDRFRCESLSLICLINVVDQVKRVVRVMVINIF